MWRRVCARWEKTCVCMCTQGSVCTPLSTTAPGNCSHEGRDRLEKQREGTSLLICRCRRGRGFRKEGDLKRKQ